MTYGTTSIQHHSRWDFVVRVDTLRNGYWYDAGHNLLFRDQSKAMDINIDVSNGPHIWTTGTYTYTAYMGSNASYWSYSLAWGGAGTGTGVSTEIYVDVCTASSPH